MEGLQPTQAMIDAGIKELIENGVDIETLWGDIEISLEDLLCFVWQAMKSAQIE
ncbi:hypothetical protein U0026_16825 [Kluyvera intermedia]|uniref:hypothetical protein n=1 Tax=Kluyvera intermedia TaxID=61648 RepID=UPI000AC8684B|nr:hypothetical protein [Kluyvera intermedia]WQD28677.1 hypothetical protein U0026_16825 [Kluyvera intermedia]VDZ84362.1 Uncharacterised protein [Kluyvera intermedia]